MTRPSRERVTTAVEMLGFAFVCAAAWSTGTALGMLVTGLSLVLLGALIGRS